ncbi:MAG: hypothetical protein Tsb009_14940 [Planctomycetaceae bacterium]
MGDIRRVTFWGVLFAVLLRMAIGWQFFYEGLWKYDSLDTSKPWSAAGYLKNARGPFRAHFRGMLDDPDDLQWLDYDTVESRWQLWEKQFVEHYELTDEQKQQLKELLDGPKWIEGRSRFPEIADGIKIGGSLAREKIIEIKQDKKNRYYLAVSGEKHLTPREQASLLRMAKKIETQARARADAAKKAGDDKTFKKQDRQAKLADAFARAVRDVYKRNTRLAFRERLASLLKGDPERVTRIREDQEPGTVDHKRPGKVQEYKERLERYEKMLADAQQEFQHEHLEAEQKRIRELWSELVGPVKKLDADMKRAARAILTDKQLAKGPPPKTDIKRIDRINFATMWGLMILGGLMIVGLFSRLAAFAGACLVFSFYLVMPPWPGVPEPPGPEHSLIVNKNLIEVLALLMLASIPTGKWFGIDALCGWIFSAGKRSQQKKQSPKPTSAPISPAEKVVQAGREKQEQEATASASSADTYAIRSGKGKK